ncbi:unnamed protein product [Parascedosporium putredinis]|uniref:Uncharacterized protein n=1 Tax=Parascedosporium putredinis TaxID=1442378 RepID=A0A9P1H7J7_9PEZI|nr:unnamed protein product [Parascedosporium putredinis]CAI7999781.1 unnamed protein product [Parascedosporium putredinis]
MGFEGHLPSTSPIEFPFGWSTVHADATFPDASRRNVLLITVRPSLLRLIVISVLPYLPEIIRSVIGATFPGILLPTNVIVKKQKPGWEDEFEEEKARYRMLESLQGDIIPQLFGEIRVQGTRALLLSYVAGIRCDKVSDLEVEHFQQLLEDAHLRLRPFGYVHDDPRLDNYILVDGQKIVIVDLEHLYEIEETEIEYTMGTIIRAIVKIYRRSYKNHLEDI